MTALSQEAVQTIASVHWYENMSRTPIRDDVGRESDTFCHRTRHWYENDVTRLGS